MNWVAEPPALYNGRCVFCERDPVRWDGASIVETVERDLSLVLIDKALEEGKNVDPRIRGALMYRPEGRLCKPCHDAAIEGISGSIVEGRTGVEEFIRRVLEGLYSRSRMYGSIEAVEMQILLLFEIELVVFFKSDPALLRKTYREYCAANQLNSGITPISAQVGPEGYDRLIFHLKNIRTLIARRVSEKESP